MWRPQSLISYPHETDKSDNRSYRAPTDKTDNDKTDNTTLPQRIDAEAEQDEMRAQAFKRAAQVNPLPPHPIPYTPNTPQSTLQRNSRTLKPEPRNCRATNPSTHTTPYTPHRKL